jgi:hypothetical protein
MCPFVECTKSDQANIKPAQTIVSGGFLFFAHLGFKWGAFSQYFPSGTELLSMAARFP